MVLNMMITQKHVPGVVLNLPTNLVINTISAMRREATIRDESDESNLPGDLVTIRDELNLPGDLVINTISGEVRIRDESEEHDDCLWSNLPSDLIMDILSKLAWKSLLVCRCVCKAWSKATVNPYFTKLCRSHTPLMLLTRTYQLPSRLNSGYIIDPQEAIPKVVNRKLFRTPSNSGCTEVVGSCNGLFCSISIRRGNPVFLWNPITGEFLTLPKLTTVHSNRRHYYKYVHGFGFSLKSNQYKVIRIPNEEQEEVAEIYTIGSHSSSWRSLGTYPPYRCRSTSCFVNGALHWRANSSSGTDKLPKFICSFDIEKEEFHTIPSPQLSDASFWLSSLGVLGGCLYMSVYERGKNNVIQIWVMRDYAIKESWTKELTLQLEPLPELSWRTIRIVTKSSENEGILILNSAQHLFCYDPTSQTSLKKLELEYDNDKPGPCIQVFPLVPNFLPLKDIVTGKDTGGKKNKIKFRCVIL